MDHYFFTEAGFQKIKAEMEELERFIKVDVARDLATAAAHGDLRENAEYAAAKEKQANSMAKLSELQRRVGKARIVKQEDFPPDTVTLCKRVKIKNVDSGEEDEYTILGDGETDLDLGIISYQSPLATGLIGHRVGDTVEVHLPGGIQKLEVLHIDFFDE